MNESDLIDGQRKGPAIAKGLTDCEGQKVKGNMRAELLIRFLRATVVVTVGLFIISDRASAQMKCPEGRTATGQCVNVPLASGLRQTSIVFSQPKISQAAYPILPVLDFIYRYPHQLTQIPTFPTPIAGPPIP